MNPLLGLLALALTFSFAPDGHGRPTKVTKPGASYYSNIAYHPNGLVASAGNGNGDAFSQTLTARQQPLVMKNTKAGQPTAFHLAYTYEARGKVASVTDHVDPIYDRSFTYDPNGRVLTANGSWGTGSFKYDALNNIREKKLGARTVTINYGADKRVSSVTDTANPSRSFGYDAPRARMRANHNPPVSATFAENRDFARARGDS